MYHDVLVPTDGSPAAGRAIEHAIAIADRFDATVHGLYVLVEGPYDSLEQEDVRAEADAEAQRALDHLTREADRRGVDTTTSTSRGTPDEEILAFADEMDVDMIVMGTAGRSGLNRVLVGSVTEYVARNATVPVVTVREHDRLRVEDASEAESIAVDALVERGHTNPTLADQPHRTSGSWIVPIDGEEGRVHVHVDAASGEVRIATID